jgi:hypothetical protein
MKALFVLIVALGVPGLVPAVAMVRRSPAVIFLAPMIGAAMAAVAAELVLAMPGSLLTDYVHVAIVVNVLVIGWWLGREYLRRAGHVPPGKPSAPWSKTPWVWSVVTAAVIVAALRLPLEGLRAQIIGWDANSIWVTHALLISGGHHVLLAGLQNPVYKFTNPDYPPLVPAIGALAFSLFGRGQLYLAANVTELIAACGLGLAATGLVAAAEAGRWRARIPALAVAGAICILGFGLSPVPSLVGYADLPWAAAAAAGVIWGLVMPKSAQALIVSWICVVAASLTKNEGLTSALGIIVLIALRYRPLAWPRLRPYRKGRFVCMHCVTRATVRIGRAWAERVALVVIPALPGLTWAEQIHHIGLSDEFFGAQGSSESYSVRASATIKAMEGHLHVAVIAFCILLAGSILLRKDRKRLGLANPAWLWLACAASLASIFVTYVIGVREIHTWLHVTVDRTTIFAQLALCAEIAVWLVVACDAALRWEPGTFRWRPGRAQPAHPDRERSSAERAGEVVLAETPAQVTAAETSPAGETLAPAGRGYTAIDGSGFTAIGSLRESPSEPDEPELSHDDVGWDHRAAELAGLGPPDA